MINSHYEYLHAQWNFTWCRQRTFLALVYSLQGPLRMYVSSRCINILYLKLLHWTPALYFVTYWPYARVTQVAPCWPPSSWKIDLVSRSCILNSANSKPPQRHIPYRNCIYQNFLLVLINENIKNVDNKCSYWWGYNLIYVFILYTWPLPMCRDNDRSVWRNCTVIPASNRIGSHQIV